MLTRRPKVLVVEDDDTLRFVYRTGLAIAGFDVLEAANGLDALRSIDRDPPDAVVLDLGLPLVSGDLVRDEIAAAAYTRSVPVIVVTGSEENLDSLNVSRVIRKPVSSDKLAAVVWECLGAPGELAAQSEPRPVR